eukprot:gene3820-3374_t
MSWHHSSNVLGKTKRDDSGQHTWIGLYGAGLLRQDHTLGTDANPKCRFGKSRTLGY